MRIAAGILMIVVGIALALFLRVLIWLTVTLMDIPVSQDLLYLLSPFLLMVISGVVTVIGGVFCVKRRYRKVCFSSALHPLGIMIYWCVVTSVRSWFVIPVGILPIVFVSLRRREWSESQA